MSIHGFEFLGINAAFGLSFTQEISLNQDFSLYIFLLSSKQCRIIWTTELAAAQEKLNELEKRKDEILGFNSPLSLLQKLQDGMITREKRNLRYCTAQHSKLLEQEIDQASSVQKFKRCRNTYHRRRALLHLAAETSIV